MLFKHIALVPEAGGVSPSELLRVSAALQKQVGTQFGPCWDIQATVDAFSEVEDVPAGYRPIVLGLPDDVGAKAGIHLDENGQPFARVSLTTGWSLAASRVCLELLVNPFGQRTLSAPSPRSDQGPVEILVEVCGAFGDLPRPYAINDVPVADFCTPAFYDAPARSRMNDRYSFCGSFTAPFQLLRGGHLTWFDAISNSWWLRTFHDELPSDLSLGALRLGSKSVRELVKRHEPSRALALLNQEPLEARIGLQWSREQASAAARARGQRLRELLGSPPEEGGEPLLRSAPTEPYGTRVRPPVLARIAAVPAPPKPASGERALEAESRTQESPQGRSDASAAEPEVEARAATREREPEKVVPSEPPVAPVVLDAEKRPPAALDAEKRAPAAEAVKNVERAQIRPPALAGPAASTARASKPPPLPLSSSIAPTAMFDSRARPQSASLGVLVTGAAVLGLGVAIWLRSESVRSRESQAVPAATTTVQAASVLPPPSESNSQTPFDQADGGKPVAPQESTPAEVPATARRKSERSPVAAADSAQSSQAHAKGAEASEKPQRKQRASVAGTAPTPDDVSRDAQPRAAIENLFDTRR